MTELLKSKIRLLDGTTIDIAEHEVSAEVNHVQMGAMQIVDQYHVSVIVDGVLVALMARYSIEPADDDNMSTVVLKPCHLAICHCRVLGPLYVQALLQSGDNMSVTDEIRAALSTEYVVPAHN